MLICFATLFPGKGFKTMCYHLHGMYFFKFGAPPNCNNMDKETQRTIKILKALFNLFPSSRWDQFCVISDCLPPYKIRCLIFPRTEMLLWVNCDHLHIEKNASPRFPSFTHNVLQPPNLFAVPSKLTLECQGLFCAREIKTG